MKESGRRHGGASSTEAGRDADGAASAQIPLVVSSGADEAAAIGAALAGARSWLHSPTGTIAVLVDGERAPQRRALAAADRLARFLVEALPHDSVTVVPQPSWLAATVGQHGEGRWIGLPSGTLHQGTPPVRVVRPVARAGARCLVGPLPDPGTDRRASPIFALAAYAHPRQRLAIRLTPVASGLAAELALALRPRLTLLVGSLGPRPLAVATPDVVAAELAWLALREGDDPERPEPGPWEDPVVQRTTELDGGVRLPAQLRVVLRSPDAPTDPLLTEVGERLRLRLGIG